MADARPVPVGYRWGVISTEEVQQASGQQRGGLRGWRLDVALALAVGVIQVAGSTGAAQGQPEREPLDAAAAQIDRYLKQK